MSRVHLPAQLSERTNKVAWIDHQVAGGALVIRQATAEERERYGIGKVRPRSQPPRRRQADH